MTKTQNTKPIAHGTSDHVADPEETLSESLQEFRDLAVGRLYELDMRAMEYAQQAMVGAWDFAGALAQALGIPKLSGNWGDDLGTLSTGNPETSGIECPRPIRQRNRTYGPRRGALVRSSPSPRT